MIALKCRILKKKKKNSLKEEVRFVVTRGKRWGKERVEEGGQKDRLPTVS